jgi:hypothetical protein
MTYEHIYKLKFKDNVPTFELRKRFPGEGRKITKVALLQLPRAVLRELIVQEKEFKTLMVLRKALLKRKNGRRAKKKQT